MLALKSRPKDHKATRHHMRLLMRDLENGFCNMKEMGICKMTGRPCRTLFYPDTCPVIRDIKSKLNNSREVR